MNVRVKKPLRKGETRFGILSREQNGVACFDETDRHWLLGGKRKTYRLKNFPRGTTVSRRENNLVIKLIMPMESARDYFPLGLDCELCDALDYCSEYAERRLGK